MYASYILHAIELIHVIHEYFTVYTERLPGGNERSARETQRGANARRAAGATGTQLTCVVLLNVSSYSFRLDYKQ
jgi:hypothetical protein